MPFAEYGDYDALGLAELVRKKEVSPSELLDEAIARAERINPKLNAIIRPLYERARELIGGFDSFRISHVRREQNRDADRMVNVALDRVAEGDGRAQVFDLPHTSN